MNMKKIIRQTLLFAVSLILLYFAFANTDFKELWLYIKNADIKYIFLLGISIVTALSFRGLCFKQLISKAADIPLKDSALLCLTASAMNIVIPARAGDMFRAFYTGQKYGVNKLKVFGTVMFERILDMIVICSFLFLGICFYKKSPLAFNLCLVALFIIIAGFAFALTTYKFLDIDKLCNKAISWSGKIPFRNFTRKVIELINKIFGAFCSGFEILDSPKKLLSALITSFTIWFFECLNYVITFYALHLDVHFSLSIFIICFIVFAGLIPSTSIFLGPAQIAVLAAFSLYNLDKETALAVSLLEQGICTILCVIIAVFFLLKNNISFTDCKENLKE